MFFWLQVHIVKSSPRKYEQLRYLKQCRFRKKSYSGLVNKHFLEMWSERLQVFAVVQLTLQRDAIFDLYEAFQIQTSVPFAKTNYDASLL